MLKKLAMLGFCFVMATPVFSSVEGEDNWKLLQQPTRPGYFSVPHVVLLEDKDSETVEIDLASSQCLSSNPFILLYNMVSFGCRAIGGGELTLDSGALSGIIEAASQVQRQPTTNMSGVVFVPGRQAFGTIHWVEYSYTPESTAQAFHVRYPWCKTVKFCAPTVCRGFSLPIRFTESSSVMAQELRKVGVALTGLRWTTES